VNGTRQGIILFNPRSAEGKHRLPNSILQVGATVYGTCDLVFIDGNRERDPWEKIANYLNSGKFGYFGCTVMPGPQLKQAIPFTRRIRELYPSVTTIWGGYFASNHYETAIRSGYIDYIIRGPADLAFPRLIDCLEKGDKDMIGSIGNLVYFRDYQTINVTPMEYPSEPDAFPPLPYEHLGRFYPISDYLARTFMGNKTFSYHSSFGCPHDCAFCGVAMVFRSSWKGLSAEKMFRDIMEFNEKYPIDAVEFHDNNFFVSHTRIIDFCQLMRGHHFRWWAEGRVDSLNRFTDAELLLLRESGCCMVFVGAESGDDSMLQKISKGGNQKANDTLILVKRLRLAGIIPELSFVFGFPADTRRQVEQGIKNEIRFIRDCKKINPESEIIIYLYCPVPASGTFLGDALDGAGFSFPLSLEDWLKPEWQDFDLRKSPGTPWLKPGILRYIRDFETVINAAFPSVSNFRVKGMRKKMLEIPGKARYYLKWYRYPLFLRAMLRNFRYRPADKEGFYSE
jgi:anaerobic magnesium-protoporphyrin IX monomethyl ester cyclase